MKDKKQFYLVGNAHLDPVWQWKWQEGSAEAKATIRSALDRMNEFEDFKFVCSSASVYKWVKEFDSEMFEEIKTRVKEGRFIIVGGWHVQPDCNLPSGEGFARQSLYSQRFFKENLGKTAEVGYNIDSFGHNWNIPQILLKSGMKQYVFMRPAPYEKEMKSDIFNWVSPDGSSVLTYRILDPYCFNFNDEEELKKRIDFLNQNTATDLESIPFFYGVGNHGGGPTIRNLEVFNEYKKAHPELQFTFSNLVDFFDEVRNSNHPIPTHNDDLQHHAAGCYATLSHVKNGIRRSETSLLSAESFSMLANVLCNKPTINEKLAEAWEKVCFLHFHDVMCGCCIKEAHDDMRYIYGAAQEIAEVAVNNSLQTISWAVDTSKDVDKGLPIFVFNPHPFEVEQFITVNKYAECVLDDEGNEVKSQLVRSQVKECFERDDIGFFAKIPPLGYVVYYLVGVSKTGFGLDLAKRKTYDCGELNAYPYEGVPTANACARVTLENEYWNIKFDVRTGYIASIFDKKAQRETLSDYACVPTVIDEYLHDTWSHGKNFFTNEIGKFSDAKITVIEKGPIRATVKVENRYNDSTLTQYFSLYSNRKEISVRAKLNWNEKHKMLKLAWPFDVKNPKACYEIPFGVITRPVDGEEEPGLTWFGVKGDNGGFAILNNDTYSSSVKDTTLYHTVVRSPIYADHGGPRDEESVFTDQGEREFKYVLTPYSANGEVIKKAKVLNYPLVNIIENWHKGKIFDKRYGSVEVSADNVIISAIKRSEDGKGTVVRVYETDGKDVEFTASGTLLKRPLTAKITRYSVDTYYLPDDGSAWRKVLLTEYDE